MAQDYKTLPSIYLNKMFTKQELTNAFIKIFGVSADDVLIISNLDELLNDKNRAKVLCQRFKRGKSEFVFRLDFHKISKDIIAEGFGDTKIYIGLIRELNCKLLVDTYESRLSAALLIEKISLEGDLTKSWEEF